MLRAIEQRAKMKAREAARGSGAIKIADRDELKEAANGIYRKH